MASKDNVYSVSQLCALAGVQLGHLCWSRLEFDTAAFFWEIGCGFISYGHILQISHSLTRLTWTSQEHGVWDPREKKQLLKAWTQKSQVITSFPFYWLKQMPRLVRL